MKHIISNSEMERAASIIREGGLVAFPTETVYGLGADALNPNAVARIFEEKERPSFDPLIVHIADISEVEKLCNVVWAEALNLLALKFWPGPLTIVMQKNDIVPDIVTSGLDTVGIRMPSHSVAIELIRKSGRPIAAPSANKFGLLSPTTAAHVKKQLKGVECVLDGGTTTVGIESTVIELKASGFVLLRPGIITREELIAIIPEVTEEKTSEENKFHAPGLLKSHYSPQKPLYILGETFIEKSTKNAAYILFGETSGNENLQITEVLSPTQDLKEAAINLFRILHSLEDTDIDFIVSEPVPEIGIGVAIMDRLRKAAFRFKNN